MPTRFFNHIRRVDDLLTADIQAQQAENHGRHHLRPFLVALPGPWAFITSGYALTLLMMVGTHTYRQWYSRTDEFVRRFSSIVYNI